MEYSKNEYILPVHKQDVKNVRFDSPAHKGPLENAIDYELEEGRPILAAASGKVVFVKDDSNVGGPDKKYWHDGNRVVIQHPNGEFSAYEHLKFKGALVKKGEEVKEGQIIGNSGNTGFTFGPHLHFEIFKFVGEGPEDIQTLKVKFKDK